MWTAAYTQYFFVMRSSHRAFLFRQQRRWKKGQRWKSGSVNGTNWSQDISELSLPLLSQKWHGWGAAKVRECHLYVNTMFWLAAAKYVSLISAVLACGFLFYWIRVKIKTIVLQLCMGKSEGKYRTVKGVSIPDRNLVCGEKASHCGCWLFSQFQFRSGQWFSPQCKVRGIESGSSRILLLQRRKAWNHTATNKPIVIICLPPDTHIHILWNGRVYETLLAGLWPL